MSQTRQISSRRLSRLRHCLLQLVAQLTPEAGIFAVFQCLAASGGMFGVNIATPCWNLFAEAAK
jgi:hypothetical protein